MCVCLCTIVVESHRAYIYIFICISLINRHQTDRPTMTGRLFSNGRFRLDTTCQLCIAAASSLLLLFSSNICFSPLEQALVNSHVVVVVVTSNIHSMYIRVCLCCFDGQGAKQQKAMNGSRYIHSLTLCLCLCVCVWLRYLWDKERKHVSVNQFVIIVCGCCLSQIKMLYAWCEIIVDGTSQTLFALFIFLLYFFLLSCQPTLSNQVAWSLTRFILLSRLVSLSLTICRATLI